MNLIQPVFPHVPEEQTMHFMEALTRLQELVRRSSTRIAIKLKGRVRLLKPADVVAVVAEGNYVSLQQESNSYLLRKPISALAEKLEPFGFGSLYDGHTDYWSYRITGPIGLTLLVGCRSLWQFADAPLI